MLTYLFLDDLRNPEDVTWVKMPKDVVWVVVRSYVDAVEWVNRNGWPHFIAFDHDLSDIDDTDPTYQEKTGYDFAKFLVGYALDGNAMPADFDFVVHSMNYVGSRRITQLFDNYRAQL